MDARDWDDIWWAIRMWKARRHRRNIGFAARMHFDRKMRRPLGDGNVIDYPDAIYHHTQAELDIAIAETRGRSL